jgi:exopolysaccharide biosynthesis polyprenyl glycosylphosphotransferase
MSVSTLAKHSSINICLDFLSNISFKSIVKRLMDLLLATAAIIMLMPLLVLVALLIKLNSKGPVLFRQLRVGRNGKLFLMWKFRSMYEDAEERKQELIGNNDLQGNLLFKMKSDPRITAVGRVIRKLSLDELPQLWNVLQGAMSMVGPRPAIPEEVLRYTHYHARRLLAKPGITCIWQVSGRSNIPFEQQVELDLLYIRRQSLWTDLKLLLQTIPAVVLARGAY